jgi:hypothetical protein
MNGGDWSAPVELRSDELDRLVLDGDLPERAGGDEDGEHHVLGAIRSVLSRPDARFALRSEGAGDISVHRGWRSSTGLVVVSGLPDPDVTHRVRLVGGPDTLARTIAGLIDLGPTRPSAASPTTHPMSWDEVIEPVPAGRAAGWVADWQQDHDEPLPPLRLHHLRFTSAPAEQATTVLVLIDAGVAGLVSVEPVAPAPGRPSAHRLQLRRPAEIWAALTAISAAAGSG